MRDYFYVKRLTRSVLFIKKISTRISQIFSGQRDIAICQRRYAQTTVVFQLHAKVELSHHIPPKVLMPSEKTHREVQKPQMSARYLADYMAASETRQRTIVRDSKYRPIGRVVQHEDAKVAIAKFWREGKNLDWLLMEGERIRNKLCDDDFERDVADHNADYVARFASVVPTMDMPAVEVLSPGATPALTFHGLKVTMDIRVRLRRLTRTNKVKLGAITFRYAKGKRLPDENADWQSSFTLGYINATKIGEQAEAENALCLTLDAFSGRLHPASTRAVSNFKNMISACATIAERWPNIRPPAGAII